MKSSPNTFVVWIILFFAQTVVAQDILTLRDGTKVTGKIVRHDENAVTLQTDTVKKQYKWEQLHPKCAYELMRQYVDPSKASAHWALAEYCIVAGLIEEGKAEYLKCLELDPSYAKKVTEALASLELLGNSKIGKDSTPTGETPFLTQEDYIARQRQNGKKVNDKLGTKLKTYETEHFIIHSDFTNQSDMRTIQNWCEKLYERLSEVLDVKPGDRLWNGKGEIYLFYDRSDFVRFARTFDRFDQAKLSGGYFIHKGRDCHIVIPRCEYGERGKQRDTFLYTLLHEGSHAFLQLHGNMVEIKPWLHEGFAQYLQFRLPSGSEPDRQRYLQKVKAILAKPGFMRFNELRALDQILGNDHEAYALSWSVVDFLITSDRTRKKFAQFIRLIKEGKDEDTAIMEAFNMTPAQLEQAWFRYVRTLR